MTDFSHPAHVRSALFVDFDNIYLGLQNEDPRAAEQFATHPGALARAGCKRSCPTTSTDAARKILFRRCYLNPSQFGRFRPYFIRSAFEVVDCPPLTSGGKTSADIHMVMDILDTLEPRHPLRRVHHPLGRRRLHAGAAAPLASTTAAASCWPSGPPRPPTRRPATC